MLRAYWSIISTVQQPPKSLAIFHLAWKLFISYTQEAETIVGLGRESFSSSRSQVLLMQHSVTSVKNHVSSEVIWIHTYSIGHLNMVQRVLALCEFHYCEFHYCNFSKKSINLPYLCIVLMHIFGYFISLVRFFGLIWLMRIFSRTKSRIRQEPSVIFLLSYFLF